MSSDCFYFAVRVCARSISSFVRSFVLSSSRELGFNEFETYQKHARTKIQKKSTDF